MPKGAYIRNNRPRGVPKGYVRKWEHKPTERTFEDRFWEKVEKTADCWNWIGSIRNDGYGQLWREGRVIKAHHASLFVHGIAPYRDGYVVDHICRNRACVNPAHLRFVTPKVNGTENNASPHARNARKTQCVHGHEFTPENTAMYQGPRHRKAHRVCLTCHPTYWRFALIPRDPPPGARPWRKPRRAVHQPVHGSEG